MLKWFMYDWWAYLLAPKSIYYNWFTVINCRRKGHEKVIWYNIDGLEPNMTCTGCGDNLG